MNNLQSFLKGNMDNIGKELLNKAGEAAMAYGKEFLGQAINEMFIKKDAPSKRILPSIQNMKIVSCSGAYTIANGVLCYTKIQIHIAVDLEIPLS
jgi:hypothetical protein